jgi:hypothetical protein
MQAGLHQPAMALIVGRIIMNLPPCFVQKNSISQTRTRTYRSAQVRRPFDAGEMTHRCRMGADCRVLRALGLKGDRSALPRRDRPMCWARNRQGHPCSVRVEPGKRRCRFHGGLSTGPKTVAGRARIAEAQRRRWSAFRRGRNHPLE